MDESTSFDGAAADASQVISHYWERFLFLLPNILVALLIFFIALWLAGKVKQLVGGRLTHKAHDAILGEYLAVIAKWVVVISVYCWCSRPWV